MDFPVQLPTPVQIFFLCLGEYSCVVLRVFTIWYKINQVTAMVSRKCEARDLLYQIVCCSNVRKVNDTKPCLCIVCSTKNDLVWNKPYPTNLFSNDNKNRENVLLKNPVKNLLWQKRRKTDKNFEDIWIFSNTFVGQVVFGRKVLIKGIICRYRLIMFIYRTLYHNLKQKGKIYHSAIELLNELRFLGIRRIIGK